MTKTTTTCDDCGKPVSVKGFQMAWADGKSNGAATGPSMMYADVVFSNSYMHGVTPKKRDLCSTCHLKRLVALGKLAQKTLRQNETGKDGKR